MNRNGGCRVTFTCINKTEACYVEVKRGSTFKFTCDLPYIASISFMCIKFTCVGDTGNPP